MKILVIKWWRVALLGLGLAASASADGDAQPTPTKLPLKPVPVADLAVRPDATFRKLINDETPSTGWVNGTLTQVPRVADTFAPTRKTVPVICVSGCEGLFRVDIGSSDAGAS